MIPAPVEYDIILRQMFGNNYMIPVKKDSAHEYPNYAGEERLLRAMYESEGKPFPECFM